MTNNALSITQKKQEVLKKINEVIEVFADMKEKLTKILEENKDLDFTRQSPKSLKQQKLIDQLKPFEEKKNNTQMHVLHWNISDEINKVIEKIITETKLRTIITVSLQLPELIDKLKKFINTWIWVELATRTFDKFTPISTCIDLETIHKRITEQIWNIDSRIKDANSIIMVMEHLEISDNSPILDELINYILWWVNYDEIENKLKENWIIIDNIVATEARHNWESIDPIPTQQPQPSLPPKPKEHIPTPSKWVPIRTPFEEHTQKKVSPPKNWLITTIKTLKIWINTPKDVSWRDAKRMVENVEN